MSNDDSAASAAPAGPPEGTRESPAPAAEAAAAGGRAELGRRPISAEAPAGASVSHEPDFEALKEEATRDPLSGAPDWGRVVELGLDLVGSRSKDFVAASYLAVGLAGTEGLRGLADGLRILVGMVEEHWEAGFPPVPKRLRARANAFAWLAERAAPVVAAAEPSPAERDAVEEARQALNDLAKLLDERLGDQEPPFGDLLRALREQRERLAAEAEAEPQPAPAAPQAPAAPREAAPPRPAPAAAPAAASEIVSRSDALQWIQRCATFFREKEPAGPLAYRLARIARWSDVAGDPPADGEGRTQLLPPTPERQAGLRRLHGAADWPALLENAESAFRERPLWLDAQRYAVEAARSLGGAHARLADALVDELRALLGRATGLPGLVFQDGTPLADPDTREWIAGEVRGAPGPSGAAAAPAATAAGDGALEAAREQARTLARERKLAEAIALLERAASEEGTPRGRFLARLELAGLCAESGSERLALPLFEELDEELARHGLERWDPPLAARVLRGLYRCHQRRAGAKRGEGAADRERADAVFARLCRLDPSAAAALE